MGSYPLGAVVSMERSATTEDEGIRHVSRPAPDEPPRIAKSSATPGVTYRRAGSAVRQADSAMSSEKSTYTETSYRQSKTDTRRSSNWEPPAEWLSRPTTAHSRTTDEGDLTQITTPPSYPTGTQTPDELESSRPQTPAADQGTGVVQSWRNPSINKWRVVSACVFAIGNGMNDSVPGALLPYMERHYRIGYAIVSLIFISNAIGFILAAFFLHALDKRLGRARTLMAADLLCVVAYLLMALAPPFPAFVIGFFLTGLAQATTLALNNVWISSLANGTVVLGWFHGAYGFGGLIAPIIATSLVTDGILFARFYFIMLALRACSLPFAGWAFHHFERDTAASEASAATADNTATALAAGNNLELFTIENTDPGSHEEHQPSPSPTTASNGKTSAMRDLITPLKNRTTLLGALFIFAYQGAEVSISGWVISFLINYRNPSHNPVTPSGGSSSDLSATGTIPSGVGYVTSGFWGGITLGRILLSYLAPRIGERLFTYILIAGSIGFQLLVWLLPNVIGDAVSIALLGLLLGPIWPCCAAIFSRLLERRVQHTALAFISGAGSSGGAVAPFVVGLVSQREGTWVLHPVCVGLFGVMVGTWWGLPGLGKRRE